MAINVDLVTMTQPGSTGNQTYSLASNFDPKAVIVWAVPLAADGTGANWAYGIGFGTYRSSTVQQRFTTMRGLDAATAADNARGQGSDALLVLQTQSAGLATRDLEIDLVSMQTGATSNVVLNWANLHTTASIKVFMLVLGGSAITDALVDDFTMGTGSTTQDETVVASFGKPELTFFMGNGALSEDATSPMQHFGFAVQGDAGRGWAFSQVDGNTASLTATRQRSDRCIMSILATGASAGTDRALGRLDTTVANWPTDGFRVLWDANPGNADVVSYLALRTTAQLKAGSNGAITSGSPPVTQDNPAGTSSAGTPVLGTAARASSGNVSPGIPAGLTAGAMMLCHVYSSDNVAVTATGWTVEQAVNQGTALRQTILSRAYVAGDTAPTIVHSAGGTIRARIAGFPGTTAVEAKTQGGTASTTTVTAPTLTPTNPGTALVFFGAEELTGNTSGATTFGGYSDAALAELDDNSDVVDVNTLSGCIAWRVKADTAATGSVTVTVSGEAATPTAVIGALVALTPATFTSFTPHAALLFGWNLAAVSTLQTAAADQVGFGIGAYDGTDQGWAGFTEDDALGTMDSNNQQETDHIIANYSPAAAIQSSATASFSTINLRLSWDDIDTVAREYQFLLLGDPAGGGATDYPVAVTATASGTATLARATAKALTRTATGTPTLARATGKPLAATATGTATLSRQLGKAVAVAATATGTATLVLQAGKGLVLSATATGTASLQKATAKAFALVATGTATLRRATAKVLALAATGTATLGRATGKILSGVATGAATLARLQGKGVILAATATGSATLARGTAKALAVAATGTASLRRAVAKGLTLAATGTATIGKGVAKALAAASTGTATLLRQSGKGLVLTATATGTATLRRGAGKVLAVAAAGTGTVARGVGKALGAVASGLAGLVAFGGATGGRVDAEGGDWDDAGRAGAWGAAARSVWGAASRAGAWLGGRKGRWG